VNRACTNELLALFDFIAAFWECRALIDLLCKSIRDVALLNALPLSQFLSIPAGEATKKQQNMFKYEILLQIYMHSRGRSN